MEKAIYLCAAGLRTVGTADGKIGSMEKRRAGLVLGKSCCVLITKGGTTA